MSQSQGIEARRLSRRTIATGAAWAVPVIAVGAAAPLAAASGGVIITPLPGASCKFPGQSTGFPFGYKMFFNINTSVATNFCVTSATVPGNTSSEVQIIEVNGDTTNPYCLALTPGDNALVIIVASTNSANGTGTFTYTLDGAAGGTFTAEFGNFRPCVRV
jgi:hypothetical protein